MNEQQERIRDAVLEHRVKQHVFEPSKRTVWTIVGKESEYWIDSERNFCSCPGYYFGKTAGRKICYHLEAAKSAIKEDSVEKIFFADDEYADFIAGLLSDMYESKA